MNKNLLEKLRKLTLALTAAESVPLPDRMEVDIELIESLQDEIWELEDQIDAESKDDYLDKNNNKDWY